MTPVVERDGETVKVELQFTLRGSLLEMEEAILEATNAVGRRATEEALRSFDTDGSPIRVGETKLTARGRNAKEYQTPYGVVEVERYVYQTSRGGRIFCPLEQRGRIVRGATPRFASQLSHKYAQLNVRAVQQDLELNHGRRVATSDIQNVAEWAGTLATAKEEVWEYALPALEVPIATVAVSLDGAMIPMADSDDWREAMVGTLSFYDHEGERQHSVDLAAAPEHGKQQFLQRLEREIQRAKQLLPDARFVGIADGAASNWTFLEQHTERQLIDFFHATESIAKLAQVRHPQRNAGDKRAAWQNTQCRRLKHDPRVLDDLIAEAFRLSRRASLSQSARDTAYSAWIDFKNHRHQMDDPGFLADQLPIGSGVTEAACKSLVKQRLCASGMRWKTTGAKVVLSLRALTHTVGRWTQFWQTIDQFGAECFG
jgi:hypothetical protein